MSPNLPPDSLVARAQSKKVKSQLQLYQNNLIETNGKDWLGELFLVYNRDMQKIVKDKKDSGLGKETRSDEESTEGRKENCDVTADTSTTLTWQRKSDTRSAGRKPRANNAPNNNNKKNDRTEGRRAPKRKREQIVEIGEDTTPKKKLKTRK